MSIADFIKKSPFKTFAKGELLLQEGDCPKKLFAVQDGFVKVTALDDNGGESLLWIAGKYDMVPTELLFSPQGAIKFFYTAYTDVAVYEIDKAEFLDFAKNDHSLMSEIAYSMSSHYDDLLGRVCSIEQTVVRDKIMHTLYNLAKRFSAEDSVDLFSLGLKLTHQDIADMVGATRETASIELQKLRRKRLIIYNRSKLIVHTERLAPFVAGAPA